MPLIPARYLLEGLRADLRDATRSLRREPGFTVLAVTIVAAMLTANMLLFAFLDAFFFRALPIAGAARHFELAVSDERGQTWRQWPLADAQRFLGAGSGVLEAGYLFTARRVSVGGGAEPRRSYVEVVSPAYFDLLRPSLAMGRTPGLDATGAPEPAILLSHTGCKRLLADCSAPLGRSVLVDGVSLTVAGLLPEHAGGLEPVTPDFWMLAGVAARPSSQRPALYSIGGVLRVGVSIEQANAALTAVAPVLDSAASANTTRRASIELRPSYLRESRELQPLAVALLLLFALVTFIACANFTSLHLARAIARRRDMAIRTALGATRAQLMRHLVAESLLVAALAALVAWGLTAAAIAAMQGAVFTLVSDAGMSMRPIPVDARVFIAVLALAVLVGLGCGLVPAQQVTRNTLARALGRDAMFFSGRLGAGRLRGALVVLQVALSLPLLICAGILVRSAADATRVNAGFDVDRLVDLRADPSSPRVLAHLRAQPGMAGLTVAATTPLTGPARRLPVRAQGALSRVGFNRVDENYFAAFEMRIIAGRSFHAGEAANSADVVVLSDAAARRLFAGRNAIGQSIELQSGADENELRAYEVIGIVNDVVTGFFFEDAATGAAYLPGSFARGEISEIIVRLESSNAAEPARLRSACSAAGALCEPMTLRRVLAQQRVPFLVGSQIAAALGALALGLACLGLHGLARFAVAQRTREFGIRFALGATRAHVLSDVLGESARRSGWGIAAGLPVSLGLSAVLAAWVPFLDSFYTAAYVAVPLLLITCALLAGLAPALRATAIDPIAAIRED